MDMRSFQLNFEVNVFFTDAEAIRTLEAHFEEDMQESEKLSPVGFYKRGVADRTKRVICPPVFRCSVRKKKNSPCIV